jgi:hypothetical protein
VQKKQKRPWGLYFKILLAPVFAYVVFDHASVFGPDGPLPIEFVDGGVKAFQEPLYALIALRFFSNLLQLRLPDEKNPLPRLGRSVAWAAFWSLFFLFTLGDLFTSKDLNVTLLAAGAPAFVIGRALYKEEKLVEKTDLQRRLAFALTGVILMAAGVFALGQGAGPFVPYRTEVTATALVGTVVLTLLVLLIPFMNHRNLQLRWFAREFGTARGKTVSLSTTIYGYYAFRPTIAGGLNHLEVYEYFLGLALAGYVFGRVRNHYRREMSETPYVSTHKKHSQEIEKRPDRTFVEIKETVGEFLAGRNVKDRYRGVLAEALKGSGLEDSEVAGALAKVDSYKDEKRPLVAFAFLVKKVNERNRARRLELHIQVMHSLTGGQQA